MFSKYLASGENFHIYDFDVWFYVSEKRSTFMIGVESSALFFDITE